jgi:serine/threonine protein kinase
MPEVDHPVGIDAYRVQKLFRKPKEGKAPKEPSFDLPNSIIKLKEDSGKITAFSIQKEIGAGRFGRLKIAHNLDTHETVVLKRVITDQAKPDAYFFLACVKNEKEALRRLGRLRGFGQRNSAPTKLKSYMAIDFYPGKTLNDYGKNEFFTLAQTVNLFQKILQEYQTIQQAGIIHRDIKSDNVMITPAHDVRIIDFGVAAISDTGFSEPAVFVGDDNFVAPEIDERVATNIYSAKTEVFALGQTLKVLLSKTQRDEDQPKPEFLQMLCIGAVVLAANVHAEPKPEPELAVSAKSCRSAVRAQLKNIGGALSSYLPAFTMLKRKKSNEEPKLVEGMEPPVKKHKPSDQ